MRADEVPEGLVEKAMQAAYPIAPGQVEHYLAEQEYRDVLAAVLPEIHAQALNDAADDWQRGEWANAPRRADRIQERIANGQYVGDWLRERAARLGATTERPRT